MAPVSAIVAGVAEPHLGLADLKPNPEAGSADGGSENLASDIRMDPAVFMIRHA